MPLVISRTFGCTGYWPIFLGTPCTINKIIFNFQKLFCSYCGRNGKVKIRTLKEDFSLLIETDDRGDSKGGRCFIRCTRGVRPPRPPTILPPKPPPPTRPPSSTPTASSPASTSSPASSTPSTTGNVTEVFSKYLHCFL